MNTVAPDHQRQLDNHDHVLGTVVIHAVKLFKLIKSLLKFKAIIQMCPARVFITDLLVELCLNDLQPIVLLEHTAIIFKNVIHLPIRLLFFQSFFAFLLLEVFAFKLHSLFLSQFNFLDFGSFLSSDSLELDCGAFIAELWHCVA